MRERSHEKRVQDDSWSWVGEDGVEHHGSESQITAALSAQRLAPYTLVTRSSWRDWLPAMVVGELQWALPMGARDLVRTPLLRRNEPKLPPPLEDYPALRLRLAALQSGAMGTMPSRPRSSIPSNPHLELSDYASDDFDEPTVQIDAEELERALNESRAEEAAVPTPRSGVTGERPVRTPASQNPGPLANHEVKRRALAQRLAHKMPTYPGFVVNPTPSSPPVAPGVRSVPPPAPSQPSTTPPLTPPSVPSAPIPTTPPLYRAAESAAAHLPAPAFSGETSPFTTNEPTLTSRIDSTLPEPPKRRMSWLTAVAVAGVLAGGAWFAVQRSEQRSDSITSIPLPSSSVQLPEPPKPNPAPAQTCAIDKQIQVSDFAHAQVRPSVALLSSPPRLAVGFAQTGRVAAGVTVDRETLSVTRLHSDNQTSPLWSVSPLLVGSDVKFRVSRAASTLRSTVSLPTNPPLFFGLNREGLAVRGDADLIDRLVWKTEWDTVSVPDVAVLDAGVVLVALRAGGERGKTLLGKISPSGSPLGDLHVLDTGSVRADPPALLVTEQRVVVSYAGGDKPSRDTLYIATSARSELPARAQEVLRVEQGLVGPSVAGLPGGALAVQYTVGAAGKQHVMTALLNSEMRLKGEPFVVSPASRDAYEGVTLSADDQLFSFYFVRQEYGHELWLTRLRCK